MNKKPLILLVGKSGSGKDTLAKYFEKNCNQKILQSYTTRPPRYEGEQGHTFVDYNFYLQPSNKVAHTYFNGNHYWATQEQCNNSDIYIIDPDGIKTFKKNYNSERKYIIFYLKVNPFVRFWRMMKRGDGLRKSAERIIHDRKKFGKFENEEGVNVIQRYNTKDIAMDITFIRRADCEV